MAQTPTNEPDRNGRCPSVMTRTRYAAVVADGCLMVVSNSATVISCACAPDGMDAGYALTLANGMTFTRTVVRDSLRRDLITRIENCVNGVALKSLAYAYDALSRPTARNADTFGYNERGEVTEALVSGYQSAYGYDEIGNSTSYTPNCLNQYAEFSYDADGNLLADGTLSFTYDAASRLKTVASNGVMLVANFYDAKSRRVKKVTPKYTATFFYDDWNLVEERIVYTNGKSSTIHYYWGKDISGDAETGLCYYGYRFYHPALMRWLNRDPIEEEGGLNLYSFCQNSALLVYDKDGRAYFAYRPLDAPGFKYFVLGTKQDEMDNTMIAHEQLFFEDGGIPSNLGFFDDNEVRMDTAGIAYRKPHSKGWNDCIMRKAVRMVRPRKYKLLDFRLHNQGSQYNCQDWAADVRYAYACIVNKTQYYPQGTLFIGRRQ